MSAGLSAHADGGFVPASLPRQRLDTAAYARNITEPTQKAILVHFGRKERLVLQVSYKGNVRDFAWLVPTPAVPKLSKFDYPVFHQLHYATAPVVKYWLNAPELLSQAPPIMLAGRSGVEGKTPAVEVIERSQIGFYDLSVLRAGRSGDLIGWLRRNGYSVTAKAAGVLSDYIRRGWVFTAARITTGEEEHVSERLSEGVLQSIELEFHSPNPIYPLRISSLNGGRTDILLYVACDHRVMTPLLETKCVLRNYVLHELTKGLVDPDALIPPDIYLTKLTGNMAAAQMTDDLTLKRAPTNDLIAPEVWAPFFDNLGALSLLAVSHTLAAPLNLVAVLVCIVVAARPLGQRYKAVWIAAACLAFVSPLLHAILLDDARRAQSYSAAGMVTLCLVFGAMVLVLVSWRRVRKGTPDRPAA